MSAQAKYRLNQNTLKQLALTMTTIGLTACSTISIKTQNPVTQLVEQRKNVITASRLSTNSAAALRTAGLDENSCYDDFDECLIKVEDSLFTDYTPRQLAFMAELHYAQALNISNSSDCKTYINALTEGSLLNYSQTSSYTYQQCMALYHTSLLDAIRYSYAYLFFDSLTGQHTQTTLANELDFQTQDIYNAATTRIIQSLYQDRDSLMSAQNSTHLSVDDDRQVKSMTRKLGNNTLDIYVPNDDHLFTSSYLQSNAYADNAYTNNTYANIESLTPTANLKLSGLNSISKQAGFGISYIAQIGDRHTTRLKETIEDQRNKLQTESDDPVSRIYPTGNLLLTSIIKPTGKTLNSVLTSPDFEIHLYNPYRTTSVNILGKDYPLAANYSASYASWITENQLKQVSYLNMLYQKEEQTLPRLFVLEPYDPNKQVIIMLHGLASSPMTWVGLTNDILNDEALREHFQVWQVFYPTNLPMLENRYQIQRLLDASYELVGADINSTLPASKNSVLIGHSMGGVIGRLMLSNTDLTPKLNELVTNPIDETSLQNEQMSELLLTAFNEPSLNNRFKLNALPEVDTAIFISSPHKGTEFADLWFTKALRKVIQLPLEITQLDMGAEDAKMSQTALGALFLQNGPSQLSDKSSFNQLTANVDIAPNVTYHSIMGNFELVNKLNLIDADNGSDGIVPYESAHLDGAKSETVIEGTHGIHSNPETVVLLRKILHEHMQQHPINK